MNKIQTWTVECVNRLCSEELTYFQEWDINALTGIHKPEGKNALVDHLFLIGGWKWMLENAFWK